MTTPCIEWAGAVNTDGYGTISVVGRTIGVHRAALIVDGRDPGDLFALHKCDNRRCINPDHLYVGTAKQNTADAFDRGHMDFARPGRPPKPPADKQAKPVRVYLTPAQVVALDAARGNLSRSAYLAACANLKGATNMIIRQGDISFIRTGDSTGTEPATPTILAKGEESGHWHTLIGGTVSRVNGEYIVDVPHEATVVVEPATHASRHAPIVLPAGRYLVPGTPSPESIHIGQREYTPEAIRPAGD